MQTLLYGVLSVGKTGMIGVPSEIIDVVSALIIFFVGANYIIKYWIRPRHKSVKAKGGAKLIWTLLQSYP